MEDDDSSAVASVDGATLKHTEVDDYAGGASRLSKSSLGSSALTAALTLHPCIYVSGCGQASKAVLQQIFSQTGPCSVTLVEPDEDDEEVEPGKATGEASVTYNEAAHAVAAIQRFDGSPFDDGKLSVTVSRTAAQGSLTKRGRGRNSDKMTHHDRQQMMFSQARVRQAQAEKDEFAMAREAALAAQRPKPAGPRPTVLSEAKPSGGGLGTQGAAKRQKVACCLVAKSSAAASSAPSSAPAAPPDAPPAAPPAEEPQGGALLGLGAYGSSDEASDGGAE